MQTVFNQEISPLFCHISSSCEHCLHLSPLGPMYPVLYKHIAWCKRYIITHLTPNHSRSLSSEWSISGSVSALLRLVNSNCEHLLKTENKTLNVLLIVSHIVDSCPWAIHSADFVTRSSSELPVLLPTDSLCVGHYGTDCTCMIKATVT